MKRSKLLHLLKMYNPLDSQEQEFKKQIVAFVSTHADCFERSLLEGHITGSAWLLNQDHSKALLMHHMKLDRWLQLGGHCDGEADVLAVAVKEAQEESGIMAIEPLSDSIFDIDVHLIPERLHEPAHYHYDIRFLLHMIHDEKIVQNSESKELRWIEKNAQTLPTDSLSVVRMFHKWAASKRA